MQCGDLDRHLEAFLDGQLDRAGSGMLRHHLALCGACQARVERLRQFERDTQRRFRALERAGSVWQDLELDLVASSRASAVSRLLALPRTLPPARRGSQVERPSSARRAPAHPVVAARSKGRSHGSRAAGVVLLAMALGALYQFGRAYLEPKGDVAAAYRHFLRDGQASMLRSGDAQQLEAWLAAELGLDVTIPVAPAGYRLIGADRASLAADQVGMLVYGDATAGNATPVLLFVRPLVAETASVPPAVPSTEAGLSEFSWDAASVRYTLVGHEPTEALRQFAH